jgi:hypothetical protein
MARFADTIAQEESRADSFFSIYNIVQIIGHVFSVLQVGFSGFTGTMNPRPCVSVFVWGLFSPYTLCTFCF